MYINMFTDLNSRETARADRPSHEASTATTASMNPSQARVRVWAAQFQAKLYVFTNLNARGTPRNPEEYYSAR